MLNKNAKISRKALADGGRLGQNEFVSRLANERTRPAERRNRDASRPGSGVHLAREVSRG
jgi:hypothetical protein